MRTVFISVYFVFINLGALYCQKKDGILITDNIKNQIRFIYNDFIKTEKPEYNIFMIDYYKKDTFDYFRITETLNKTDILFKEPDTFFIYDCNIIFLYSKNWLLKHNNDYEKVLEDNYLSDTSFYTYDPFIVEYKMYDQKIMNKKKCRTMYYPNVSIIDVLSYYNIKPDRLERIRCPLSKDSLPYIKIYKDTNYWYCKKSGCDIKSGGIIEFIMKYENITRKEAFERVKEICINKQKQNN